MEIVMQKDNVVKCVDSEDKAMALAEKGFIRQGEMTVVNVVSSEKKIEELKQQLAEAAEVIKVSNERKAELEAQLTEAEKQIQELKIELEGTKEQLEAAVKKNKTTGTK